MKKREDNRKIAQVNILIIILTIVLILALVIVVWNILNIQITKNLIQANTEAELMGVRITLGVPEGNLSNPINNRIIITISRFDSGKLKKISENNTNVTIIETSNISITNVSLVSAIDLSGSMGDTFAYYAGPMIFIGTFGECRVNPNSACCMTNNCSTEAGCSNCNGNFINNQCYLYSLNSCCRTADCYTSSGCTSCGGSFKKDSSTWNTPSCKIANTEVGCFFDKEICTGVISSYPRGSPLCNGLWKNKLQLTQEANNNFIDNFLNNSGNEMGVVGFRGSVYASDTLLLTVDKTPLHNKINYLTIGGSGTNICEGLNSAINQFPSSTNNKKIIILMSDGNPNLGCNDGRTPIDGAIVQAARANQSNITIHTIGFGKDADSLTLKRIANSTKNGTYSYADVSNINLIYNQISENITKQSKQATIGYSEEYSWDHIRAIVYNATNSFASNITEIIHPIETRKISIPTGGLTNINKIEIYLIAYTKDKREYSRLLDRWVK